MIDRSTTYATANAPLWLPCATSPINTRHRQNGEHRAEVREPERQVIGIEAARERRVSLPRDVNRNEERREAQEAAGGVIGDEVVRELRDRDDEDEIEEELEPARVPLTNFRERSQARRLKPARGGVGLRRLLEPNSHQLDRP